MPVNQSANLFDQPRVIAGAIGVFSAGSLLFNMLPLLLGVSADALALTLPQLGLLGSAYMAVFALSTLPAVALLQRLNWRAIGLGAGAIGVTALFAAARCRTYTSLFAVFLISGVTQSLLFALGNRVLGAASDADRSYGFAYWISLGIAAGLIFVCAQLIVPTWGFVGVYVTAAVAIGVLAAGASQLPRAATVARPGATPEQGKLTAAIAFGLLAMVVYFVGLAGLWTFVERIGVSRHIAVDTVGTIVSASLLATAFGALVPIATEGRYSRGTMLLAGSIITLVAMVLLALPGGMMSFLAGSLLFNLVWGAASVYISAIIASADSSGRFLPLIGGATGIGASFGPALAGVLIHGSNYTALFVMCGVAVIVSATLAILSERRA